MVQAAAIAGVVVLLLLMAFQSCLAAGAPWGRLAWGGAHDGVLPVGLRVASLVTVAIYLVIAAILLDAAGLARLVPWPWLVRPGIWGVAILFGAGLVLNLISRSRAERRLMAPVAAVLTLCVVVVALG